MEQQMDSSKIERDRQQQEPTKRTNRQSAVADFDPNGRFSSAADQNELNTSFNNSPDSLAEESFQESGTAKLKRLRTLLSAEQKRVPAIGDTVTKLDEVVADLDSKCEVLLHAETLPPKPESIEDADRLKINPSREPGGKDSSGSVSTCSAFESGEVNFSSEAMSFSLTAEGYRTQRMEQLAVNKESPVRRGESPDAEAYDKSGSAKLAKGDVRGAVKDFEKAAEIDPNNPKYQDHKAGAVSTIAA